MKKQNWVERIGENSLIQIVIFCIFLVLVGSFTFLAFRARTNLAAARGTQASLSQQAQATQAAGSMNVDYSQGWLANGQNFSELSVYVNRLVDLSGSPSLDSQFKQQLSDYVLKNRSQLAKESDQIRKLSFSEGILRQHQLQLLDMYEQLNIIFRTMDSILSNWNSDELQLRAEEMITIQDSLSLAQTDFQATTASHQKILGYASLLNSQSKQAYATELDQIRRDHTQFSVSLVGLIVSSVFFAGWIIFLIWYGKRYVNR